MFSSKIFNRIVVRDKSCGDPRFLPENDQNCYYMLRLNCYVSITPPRGGQSRNNTISTSWRICSTFEYATSQSEIKYLSD